MMTAETALGQLWQHGFGSDEQLPKFSCTGPDEYLPTVFSVTTAATAAIGVSSAAAAVLLQIRNGNPSRPAVDVDRRHAAVVFRGERYLQIGGERAAGLWERLSGNYRTADGRWLLLHANMPPHRAAALAVLGADANRDAVAAAIATWDGVALEDALAAAGGCCAVMRTVDEWQAHPQSDAIASLPPIEVDRIGDAPSIPRARAERPATGIKVLDFTRVIAGPLSARTLASHGATVLRIGADHLADSSTLIVETGYGKRSAFVDLRQPEGVALIHRLVADADVVVQGYRPGTLAARGLGPEELCAIRPGLVYVNLCAYGRLGPWAPRRGFDSLVQMATGIAATGAEAAGVDEPRPLPAQALDHASGYLGAFGALAALCRQAREGGSWLVQLSLAQTGAWLQSLGRVDALDRPDPAAADVADLTEETESPFGRLRHIAPAGTIDGVAPRWERPPVPLGTDPPAWGD